MVLKISDDCYFAPPRIPSWSLEQLPPECRLGLVTQPLNAQHREAVPLERVWGLIPPPVPRRHSPQSASRSPRCHSTRSSRCSSGPRTPGQGRSSASKRSTLRSDSWSGGPMPACLCEESHLHPGAWGPAANGVWMVGSRVLWNI